MYLSNTFCSESRILWIDKRVHADDWTAEFPIIASDDVIKRMVGVNKQPYVTSDDVIHLNGFGST